MPPRFKIILSVVTASLALSGSALAGAPAPESNAVTYEESGPDGSEATGPKNRSSQSSGSDVTQMPEQADIADPAERINSSNTDQATSSDDSPKKVSGSGKDVPLRIAIRGVVPERFDVTYGPGVNTKQPVNWDADGEPWRKVLARIANNNDLTVSIVGTGQREGGPIVRVRKDEKVRQGGSGFRLMPYQDGGEKALDKAVQFEGDEGEEGDEASDRGSADNAGETKASQKGAEQDSGSSDNVKVTEDRKPAWKVKAGSDLRTAIERWSEKAGWDVIYESEYTYRVQADATFSGTYIQAVKKLVNAFADVKPQVNATLYKGNRVTVVSNPNSEILQ